MRRFLILALLLSSQAWGTIAFVNNAKVTNTPSGSATTETISYTPAATGNALVVAVMEITPTTTITVGDNKTNTYGALGTCGSFTAHTKVCMFAALNIVGTGAFTITATSNAASFKAIYVMEYSGVALTSATDQTAVLNNSSSTTPSANITTTNANDVLVSCFGDDNSNGAVTATAGSGYTLRGNETNGSVNFVSGCEDRIVASTGTYAGNFTLSTASDLALVHISLKEAAAASTVRRRVQVTVSQ